MRAPRLSAPRIAVLLVAVLLVVLAGWYVRNTRQAIDRLGREVRSDCAFKKDIAELPGEVPTAGQALLLLARDARSAYVGKGCPAELGPPPRPFPTATPSASPR